MATDYKIEFNFLGIELASHEQIKRWALELLTSARIRKKVALPLGPEYSQLTVSNQYIGYKNTRDGQIIFDGGFFRQNHVVQTRLIADESIDILLLALLMTCEQLDKPFVRSCTIPPRILRRAFNLAQATFPALERPSWVPDEPENPTITERPDNLDFRG